MKQTQSIVIRPQTDPFTLPDAPPRITFLQLQQSRNLWKLMKLENQYNTFIEQREQVLSLLQIIEDIIDTRNLIIMRINQLLRTKPIVIFPNTFSNEYVTYKKPSASRLIE